MEITTELAKELQSNALIRFQDCDPFGHLNNVRYIDYFLNARQDHLAQNYDFHIFDHGKQTGQNWVVTKTQIAYLFPAFNTEEVIIKTQLIHMSDSTIVVEGVMLDKAMKRTKALIWMEFTYVSLATGRTTQHSEDLLALFRSVVIDGIYHPDGFNARIEHVKRQYRKQPAEAA